MRIAGIICEYNPFHNGHAHQLAVLREAGYAPVCVMSGDYVQRGEPAVIPAAARAEAAVRCGAALVLELPPSYALRSAEGFADGGVELLDRLGCAEALCFGSESGDAEALLATARTLLSPELVPLLKQELAGGASFPAAQGGLPLLHAGERAQDCAFAETERRCRALYGLFRENGPAEPSPKMRVYVQRY